MNSLSIRFEIEEAINKFQINRNKLHEVRKDQWEEILESIESRFLVKNHYSHGLHWGWNKLKEPKLSMRFVDQPYQYIREIIEDDVFWFIVEDLNDKLWVYEGEKDIIFELIPELCHLNEYYLVSKKYQWLICEDHHEIVHLHGQEVIQRMITYTQNNKDKIYQ